MNVMLLSAGSVGHTQRWANALAGAGLGVLVVSQHDFIDAAWDERVRRVRLPRSGTLGYFLNAGEVARLYAAHRCDVLSAHYATGYGVLASLSRIRPRAVSVWGSDVYDFPRKSFVHRRVVRGVLSNADALASTSEAMAGQVRRLLGARHQPVPVEITPFGVDTARFRPERRTGPPVIVGTVKTLAPKYGIDTLLHAFQLLAREFDADQLRLRIVGDGPQRVELEALASALGLQGRVEFLGAVPHDRVPDALRSFDIFAAASRLDSESFGVAVVEASACGLPVVVTRVGGLPEVVLEGETGLIVDRDDPGGLASALRRLILDPALRQDLGVAGRRRVKRDYEWDDCVQRMVAFLGRVREGRSRG